MSWVDLGSADGYDVSVDSPAGSLDVDRLRQDVQLARQVRLPDIEEVRAGVVCRRWSIGRVTGAVAAGQPLLVLAVFGLALPPIPGIGALITKAGMDMGVPAPEQPWSSAGRTVRGHPWATHLEYPQDPPGDFGPDPELPRKPS